MNSGSRTRCMKVIICGAGQVGFNIARYLAGEDADVTVIDQSPDLIKRSTTSWTSQALVGFASHPDVLERAGAADADMIVAVTYADEVNMVACQVCALALRRADQDRARCATRAIWTRLGRSVQPRPHADRRDHLAGDRGGARDRPAPAGARRLRHDPLADGKVRLIGVHCTEDTPIINTPLRQLTGCSPISTSSSSAISAAAERHRPHGDDQMLPGDDVYFVADTAHLARAMTAFGHEEKEARRVIIVGGGNIGLSWPTDGRSPVARCRLEGIEVDKERAERVAQPCRRTVGDPRRRAGHGDPGRGQCRRGTEAVIARSNDDEVNILASLLAKRYRLPARGHPDQQERLRRR